MDDLKSVKGNISFLSLRCDISASNHISGRAILR